MPALLCLATCTCSLVHPIHHRAVAAVLTSDLTATATAAVMPRPARSATPCCSAVSASSLSAPLRVLAWLRALFLRLFQWLRLAPAAARFPTAPQRQLRVVVGSATREVAPPHDVYVRYGYLLSPFYAAQPSPPTGNGSTGAAAPVRWLSALPQAAPHPSAAAFDRARFEALCEMLQARRARGPWVGLTPCAHARPPPLSVGGEGRGRCLWRQPWLLLAVGELTRGAGAG